MQISKNDTVFDIIQFHPGAQEVMERHGLHCVNCLAATSETLEQAARRHSVPLLPLLKELSQL